MSIKIFFCRNFFLFLLCFFIIGNITAQSNYTDYNPQYKTWTNTYQIDKIEYSSTETIISIRFVRDNSKYDSPSFYPSKHEFAWVLETKDGQVYDLKRITNISKNGLFLIAELGNEVRSVDPTIKGDKLKIFFTCKIHFDALPTDLTEFSLVQGKGLRELRNHLNCLDIQLKNENKGSAEIEKERIAAFEKEILKPKVSIIAPITFSWDEDLKPYLNTAIIDEKPIYKQWQTHYYLDKIVYTETEIIFFVRFVLNNETSGGATFYSDGIEYVWFLEDVKTKQEYPISSVSNIRKDGTMIKEKLLQTEEKHYEEGTNRTTTTYTCLVHFNKLPSDVKTVSLIEGHKQLQNKNHFHFFNIKILTK